MLNRTVKLFNGQKGYTALFNRRKVATTFSYTFLAVERAGLQSLREGQKIYFETQRGRNGKIAAVNLRPL